MKKLIVNQSYFDKIFSLYMPDKENFSNKARIYWLGRRIVRKQLGIMPTYHYMQNQEKLMMQRREIDQNPQFEQFFDDFEVKYFQKKQAKKLLEPFLRKISKCLILGSFGDLFANIFKPRSCFKNPALSLFYLYSPLTSCKK